MKDKHVKKTFLCSCQDTNPETKFSGDSCGDPPVPMPNTAVKAANAESTWGEAPWEDRKPLIQQRSTSIMKCFFFCISNYIYISLADTLKDDEMVVIGMSGLPFF